MVLPQDAPYDDGANIAMNHDGGGGDDVVNISPPIIVIENISSVSHVAIDGNIDPAPDADDNVDGVVVVDSVGEAAAVIADDEASAASHLLSLSSATSATSIASTLSDGVSRPRSQQRPHQHHELPLNLRPRSVSLNLPSATLTTNNNTSTPSSRNGTPIRSMSNTSSRPRSNPRTRTPMRHVSPLLVTGRALAYGLGNAESTSTDDHGAEMATNGGGIIAHGEVNAHADTEVDAVVAVAASSNDNNSTASSSRYDAPSIRNSSRQRTSMGRGQDAIIPEEEEEELAVVVEVAVDENRNGPNVNIANVVVQEEEEVVEAEVAADPPPAPLANNNNHRPASLRHGTAHWLAQPASSTVHGSTRRSSNNPTRRRHHHDGTTTSRIFSNKQHPSHRKLRRWNNDRFVGTTSEHLHHTMMGAGDGDTIDGSDYDQYWKQHFMPNYPCTYRSEFAKLITDETKKGQRVRERFLKGEVGVRVRSSSTITTTTMMTEDIMHRMISEKFQKKLGVSLPKSSSMTTSSTTTAADEAAVAIPSTIFSSNNESMGTKIFKNLSPRIQTILSRICVNEEEELHDKSTVATSTDPFFAVARQLVASFESYLISLALVGSKEEVSPTLGYPPLQSQLTYDLFTKVLSSPPKVVMRSKTRQNDELLLQRSGRKNVHAVLVPTVHFYFATDVDDYQDSTSKRGKGGVGNNDGGKKCNSAFYRILLHSVCQFHGLESTSSLLTAHGKSQSRYRSGGQREGTTKVVTVQGGWLLAPSLKVLDACMSFK